MKRENRQIRMPSFPFLLWSCEHVPQLVMHRNSPLLPPMPCHSAGQAFAGKHCGCWSYPAPWCSPPCSNQATVVWEPVLWNAQQGPAANCWGSRSAWWQTQKGRQVAGRKAKLCLVSRYDILRHAPSGRMSFNRLWGLATGELLLFLLSLPLSWQTHVVIRLEKFNSLPDDNPPPHPIIPLEAEHFPVIDIDRTLTFLTWPNHHKVFFLLPCPRKPSGDCPQVAWRLEASKPLGSPGRGLEGMFVNVFVLDW